ncbi:MAG TPA: hypothetical protein VMT18_04535 [Planctomycetota bacterium]|nr:hypothetical protein [Planctomycetota bacterium]
MRAGDRTEEDRALDGGRRPVGLLTFIGVRPGQRVAELGAGGGYTSELLARVVGEQGAVFMHNAPRVLALIGSKRVDDRLARPAARPEGGFPGRPTAAPARPATLRSYPLTRML